MEVSVNDESVVSVPLSLSWFTLPVLDVDEIPLLVSLTIIVTHVNVSVFSINTSRNFHDLVLFLSVSEEWCSPLEKLEPS
jgi:hypothetical protein